MRKKRKRNEREKGGEKWEKWIRSSHGGNGKSCLGNCGDIKVKLIGNIECWQW